MILALKLLPIFISVYSAVVNVLAYKLVSLVLFLQDRCLGVAHLYSAVALLILGMQNCIIFPGS